MRVQIEAHHRRKYIKCAICGRMKQHYADGLCGSCYNYSHPGAPPLILEGRGSQLSTVAESIGAPHIFLKTFLRVLTEDMAIK